MASSRLYKIGSIFSRIDGLVRTGAIKYKNRPLWYDIYKAFPPKYEPTYAPSLPKIKVRQILYQEDVIRAKLHSELMSKSTWSLKESKNCWPIYETYFDKLKNGESKESACAYAVSEAKNILFPERPKPMVPDNEVSIETEATSTETEETPQANNS